MSIEKFVAVITQSVLHFHTSFVVSLLFLFEMLETVHVMKTAEVDDRTRCMKQVNLLRHYLRITIDKEDISAIDFHSFLFDEER